MKLWKVKTIFAIGDQMIENELNDLQAAGCVIKTVFPEPEGHGKYRVVYTTETGED